MIDTTPLFIQIPVLACLLTVGFFLAGMIVATLYHEFVGPLSGEGKYVVRLALWSFLISVGLVTWIYRGVADLSS